jgi:hypothetical protein
MVKVFHRNLTIFKVLLEYTVTTGVSIDWKVAKSTGDGANDFTLRDKIM